MDCNKVVLILRWSYFRGGLIARFYCTTDSEEQFGGSPGVLTNEV